MRRKPNVGNNSHRVNDKYRGDWQSGKTTRFLAALGMTTGEKLEARKGNPKTQVLRKTIRSTEDVQAPNLGHPALTKQIPRCDRNDNRQKLEARKGNPKTQVLRKTIRSTEGVLTPNLLIGGAPCSDKADPSLGSEGQRADKTRTARMATGSRRYRTTTTEGETRSPLRGAWRADLKIGHYRTPPLRKAAAT
jgi:hypothetical protein